ncbi:uncharacterized protein [Atheta coriaria]|uniref:uncharacterized protein isoform X2 n=1 Tax=Dalotia coriaria TaxID=877792 RepID=UPI0031F3DE28
MQSADSSRYINSVSDLYGDDEIEFLLDDIRELEPISCRPEDIQLCRGADVNVIDVDFEIAGSGTGEPAGGGAETPLGTVHSWDSHSHYRRRSASPDLSLYSGVIVYCDHTHLRTPTGLFRILLILTTIACLACLCTAGTVKVTLFMLPLVNRIRLMMFVTLLSIFITSLLLFLDISHIIYLFPFPWGKLNAYIYLSLSVLFLIASSLLFHTVFLSEAFLWVPKWTHQQLFITGCLGYVCCLESLVITIIQKCSKDHYQPVAEDPSMNLQERRSSSHPNSPDHVNQTTHNYKPIINYQMPAVASTSRNEPYNYLDDVQPCSSKMAHNA